MTKLGINTSNLSGGMQDETKAMARPDEQVQRAPVIKDRTMIILYGSETGNSEDIAEELGSIAERLRFQTRVDEMDNVKLVLHIHLPR